MGKILVTGASGFIGQALVGSLKREGNQVLELSFADGDIAEAGLFERFRRQDVEYVYHLAGLTFVPDSWRDPLSFYRTNVVGTLNVLEFCRESGVPLTCMSAYLYGQPERLPIKETDRLHPNNPYAHSKYLMEEACRFYAEIHGLAITVLRPFNVYGPGQDNKFLIPKVILQVLSSERIEVQDVWPRRDYVYLDDLLDAMLLCKGGGREYRVFNIGSGESHSVSEVIDIALIAAGCNKPVVSTGQPRVNEIPDVVADISRAKAELGWRPKVGFKDGIEAMVKAAQPI